jgi:fatty acid-binding protein DegV
MHPENPDRREASGARRPCGLVVDSGASMRSTGDNFLAIVDLPVRIGGWSLPPNPDDHAIADFYSRLRRGEEPITSTPSPGAYLEAFRSLHCDRILCLTIPARWSAMDATARLAARMLAEEEGTERVVVMETGTAAAGLGLVARVAALHCRAGADLEEVRARAERACD